MISVFYALKMCRPGRCRRHVRIPTARINAQSETFVFFYFFLVQVHIVGRQPGRAGAESFATETFGLRRRQRREHAGDSRVESGRHRLHQRVRRFVRHRVFDRYVQPPTTYRTVNG